MPDNSPHPKNVLVLHCDQLRYDSLGCSGNPYACTPNIDRLAADGGTVLTRHIAANPVCMPSRVSLMTGLYPSGHGVWNNGVALNRSCYLHTMDEFGARNENIIVEPPTMADIFANAGFDTAAFGKLHLTPNLAPPEFGYHESWHNWRRGDFDDWYGPYYGFRHVEMTCGHGDQPCDAGHYSNWLKSSHPDVYRNVIEARARKQLPVPQFSDLYPTPVPHALHHSNWLADRFCHYVQNGRGTDRPFFAFVGFPDPHHPFNPSYDILEAFADIDVKPPVDLECQGIPSQSPLWNTATRKVGALPEEARQTVMRYTYAMVNQVDRAVGRIIDSLVEANLWDDTIIVFTSDHGDFLCDHGLLTKALIGSDTLLHVPCIVRAPGAGLPSQIDAASSNCDILPTATDLAGVELDAWQHGVDIRRRAAGDDPYALAFTYTGNPETSNTTVYDDRYRLTWYPGCDYVELFDHQADPGECLPLGRNGQTREVADHLLDVIRRRTIDTTNPILARYGNW